MKRVGATASVAALAVASAWGAGHIAWNARSEMLLRRLATNERDGVPADDHDLPPSVARYAAFALRGAERPTRVCFRQTGTLRNGPNDPWMRFQAAETLSSRPRAFVWDAVASPFGPLFGQLFAPLDVLVRDAYVDGDGSTAASVCGVWPLASPPSSPELRRAALLRYLAECVWLPNALLTGVRWEQCGSDWARAELTDGGTTALMEVRFGSDGAIEEVRAQRHRTVGGMLVLTPWRARCGNYHTIDGVRIPLAIEVSWEPPEGVFACFRSRLFGVRFA